MANSSITLKQLEKNTKLPRKVLDFLKNQLIGPNLINKYACVLDILWIGFDALGDTFGYNGQQTFGVSKETFDYVKNVVARQSFGYIDKKTNQKYEEFLIQYLVKTPGWQQMTSQTEGGGTGAYANPPNDTKVGFLGFQLPLLPNNPLSGSEKDAPPLCEQLLNKIHPDFTDNLEKFCGLVKSRAYLALPAMAFGSLQRVVASINGVVGAFQKIIGAIYRGVMRVIQQFYAYINGIIAEIQRWLMWIIEQIIPLDLICLILEAVQVLLDDINFFTSLFSQSGSIFSYLNQIQNFINIASSALTNPLTFLYSYLPPEVVQIIDLVNQIGTDPDGFLTDMLTNYGYSYVAEALKGNIVAALVDKFGPQFRAIGPISNFISQFGTGDVSAYYPPTPSTIAPAWESGSGVDPVVDVNSNPIDGIYKIIEQTGDDVSTAADDLGKAIQNIGTVIGDEVEYIKKIPETIGNGIKDVFDS
jgi:hypothetical protein